MAFSYIFYILLLAVCGLLAFLANRYNKKGLVWMIVLLLALVSGLRDASVGIDTANYLRLLEQIGYGRFHLAYGLEESFKYITYVILRVIPSRQFVLIVFALITNWCIIFRFWELRKISSFTCMVLCYYMAYYFMTMSGMRQFVAVGIVFYCTRYLAKRKVFPFALGVLIAMQFHQSAVIGFGLLAVNCLQWKDLPGRIKLLYIFVILALPVLAVVALQLMERYAKYFANPTLDIGLMLLLKLLFLLATLIVCFAMHRRYSYFRGGMQWDSGECFELLMACIGYGLALLLGTLGYIFPYADRIGWYFALFEGVYFGALLKGKNPVNRLIFGYFIAFVIGYGFLYSMTNNSQGTMPYSFCW